MIKNIHSYCKVKSTTEREVHAGSGYCQNCEYYNSKIDKKNKVQINIVSNIGEFKNAMKRLSSENHEKSDAKKKDEKKIKNKLLVIGV